MEAVNFLAQIWGFTFVLIGLSILINPRHIQMLFSVAQDEKTAFLVYMALIPLGLALVLSHNVWSGGWQVLVTILNWTILIKGAAYMLVPGLYQKKIAYLQAHYDKLIGLAPVAAVIVVLLGCFFVYAGFLV
jgi:hypothetical protein